MKEVTARELKKYCRKRVVWPKREVGKNISRAKRGQPNFNGGEEGFWDLGWNYEFCFLINLFFSEFISSILIALCFYKHTGKLGWSSICLRSSQFQLEIMRDDILDFKTYFMAWYCVWHEHCDSLFNVQNLVGSLILMFVRISLCDTIMYTWFGKKRKPLKRFWGCYMLSICLFP